MGSVCCAASKAHVGTSSTVTSTDGYPFLESQHQWRIHGGFSPPLSSRWDPSTLTPLPYHQHHQPQPPSSPPLASDLSSFSRTRRHIQTTLSSSSHSRNASQDGSEQLEEPLRLEHSENNSFTSNSSRQNSLNGPDWISRDIIAGNFVSFSSDSHSETVLPKEAYMHSSTSAPSETSGARFNKPRKNVTPIPGKSQCSSSYHRNLSGSFSSLPKIGRSFFRRQSSDSRTSFHNGSSSNAAALGERSLSLRLGSQQGAHADLSVQAFSQFVPSSHRGHATVLDTNNSAEIIEGVPLSLERIRQSSCQSSSGDAKRDHRTCILCSRLLLHRSPWSSQRMLVGSSDLPVTGVLVCGHVFHADCLEKVVPETSKHDPPCPECDKQKHANTKSYICSTVKAASGPIKTKLAKFGPNLWKKSFQSLKSSSVADVHHEKESFSADGEELVQRSMSKKQPLFNMKLNKDTTSQIICSKKLGSPAQVSPENQI